MKKSVRWLVCLLLAGLLAMSLLACGGGGGEKDGDNGGGDKTPTQLSEPTGVRVEKDILTWEIVANASSYDVLVAGRDAVRVNNSNEHSLLYLTEPNTYSITVRAVGDGKNYFDSGYSRPALYVVGQSETKDSSRLQSLTPSVGTLNPGFAPNVFDYTLKVPKHIELKDIKVNAVAQNAEADVNIEYRGSSIIIVVTSADGKTNDNYNIMIEYDGGKDPEETIIVTFEIDGAYTTRVVSQGKIEGLDTLQLPSGKTFVGWFTQKTGGEKFDPDGTIEKSITVFAQFRDASLILSSNDSSLVFNSVDKTLSMSVSSKTYDLNFADIALKLTLSLNATMEAFSDSALTQKIEKLDLIEGVNTFFINVVSGDKTNNTVYTLSILRAKTLMVEFCTDVAKGISEIVYVDEGQKVKKPILDPYKTGHTFDGWYSDADFENEWDFENYTVNLNTRLYAKLSKNKYEVTFDSGGGNSIDSVLIEYGSQILAVPQREGYSFVGWFDSGLTYQIETITYAQKVYAKWQTEVTFMLGDEVHFAQTVFENTKITQPTQPKKAGVVFDGWKTEKDGGEYFDFANTFITKPTTLYASFASATVQADGFLYTLSDDESEYYVAGGSSLQALRIIEIPSSYNGKPVTKILSQGFMDFDNLECVIVPSSIVSIESEAFAGCGILRQAILSEGLETIGEKAFYITALEAVTIPASTKSIGDKAFVGTNIRIIRLISPTMPSMTNQAIDSLCIVIVKKEYYSDYMQNLGGYTNSLHSEESFIDGMLLSNDKTKALRYLGDATSITIPDSVTKIDDYFIARSPQVKKVTIPASVTDISVMAFITSEDGVGVEITWYYNSAMSMKQDYKDVVKHVIITPNTINVTYRAFEDFINIESVTIQSGVKSIDAAGFAKLLNLKTVTIENGLESIGETAFEDCISLQEITIPGSVKTIGSYAFYGCVNLRKAIIGDGVETISNSAFNSCIRLYDLTLSNTLVSIKRGAFYGCESLSSVILPDSLEIIEYSAFANCIALKEITIPKNVTKVEGGAFFGSRMLKKINVSEQNTSFKSVNGVLYDKSGEKLIAYTPFSFGDYEVSSTVKTIGEYAFYKCVGLTGVIIPNSVTVIETYAFAGCTALKKLAIGNSVETISSRAFAGCERLDSVRLPNSVKAVGSYAFAECKLLKTLTIGTGVESIGDYAFYRCLSLLEVTIPKNVKTIAGCAFEGCVLLENVTLENGIEHIGAYAFKNTGITSIVIPDSITTIALGTFYECEKLVSVTIGKNVTVIEGYAFYNCINARDLNIPNKVTLIGDYAFYGLRSLYSETSFVIPASVKSIGDYAFSLANFQGLVLSEGLESIGNGAFKGAHIGKITIPASVKTMGAYAFEGCNALSQVTFSEGLETIGDYAFKDCTNLVSIQVPNSVTYLGKGAFYGCYKLESAKLGSGILELADELFYRNEKLTDITFDGDITKIGDSAFEQCGFEEFVIPDSVVEIGESAFRNSKLNSITFGSKLERINEYAFAFCYELESIEIPDNVKFIGESVFYVCQGLKSVIIGSGVTDIGFNAFNNCSNIETFTLPFTGGGAASGYTNFGYIFGDKDTSYGGSAPATLKTVIVTNANGIGERAFSGEEKIESITIVDGTTSIPRSAFSGTRSLKSIRIPEGVKTIGDSAFFSSGIQNVKIPEGVVSLGGDAFGGCVSLESVELPNSLKTIGDGAFSGCVLLKSIEGEFVQSIGNSAFSSCKSLESVDFPSVVSIGDRAFYYCLELTTVDFPNALTIGYWAFNECTKLTSFTIGEKVTSIGSEVFGGCDPEVLSVTWHYNPALTAGRFALFLTNVIVSEGITEITNSAFWGCLRLESVVLPSTVETIGNSAFYNCSALTSVTIGENVTSIGEWAFGNCKALESITIPSSVESVGQGVFSSCELDVLSVTWHYNPAITAEFFSFYLTSVIVSEGITEITDDAFRECTRLESVILPSSIKTIGDYAFAFCEALTELELHDGLLSIGEYAFYRSGLIDVVIPDSVETLKREAFGECKSLISVVLPKDLTIVDVAMFMDCEALVNITIPSKVTEIGEKAFYGCGALTSITIPNSVQKIGLFAFMYCDNVESITLPFVGQFADYNATGHKHFGYLFGIQGVEGQYNALPQSLKTVTLTGSTVIPSMAFYGCNFITDITLPEGITQIGHRAFYNCEALENINIPSTVDFLDAEAFSGCESLKEITLTQSILYVSHLVFDGCKSLVIMVQGLASTPITWETDWLGNPVVATVQWNG